MILKIINSDIININETYPNINKYNSLHIESCFNLKNLILTPNITKLYISNCSKLQINYNNNYNLKKLILKNCYNILDIPKKLINLKYIELYDSVIKKIPKSYNKLETLIIKYNKNNKRQIKELSSFKNLTSLILENCRYLKKLPENLPNINKLHIISCYYIQDIPEYYYTIKDYYLIYTVNNIIVKSIKFKFNNNYDDLDNFDENTID